MKLAIMQPYLFPYIGYWQLISAVDTFVVYDDVNFITRGWINRNNILFDGKAKMITLALSKASINKLINEIDIADHLGTKEAFLKTVCTAYRKAPFFQEVFLLLEKVILNPEKNLSKYILTSLETICAYLGIQTKFIVSSDIPKNNTLRGDDKIVHICEILGAQTYINPSGGVELYHESKFLEKKMELFFILPDLHKIKYTQFGVSFFKGLSIIDILMFNSSNNIRENIIPCYQLIKKDVLLNFLAANRAERECE